MPLAQAHLWKWPIAPGPLCLVLALPSLALGGTPFFTDDPGFAPSGWEIDVTSLYEVNRTEQVIAAPVLTANYSFTEHFQLDGSLAVQSVFPDEGPAQGGLTDTDLHLKWRLIDDKPGTGWPAVSITPGLTFPTATGPQEGQWRGRFPVQIGKTFGKFYPYIEIGYQHVFRKGDERGGDQVLFGAALQYQPTDRWMVGVEINGLDDPDISGTYRLLANVAASYSLSERLQVQAMVGRTLRDESLGDPQFLVEVVLVWFLPEPGSH